MINPLEQRPLLTVVFRCENDGLIPDDNAVIIDDEFCCPFCCEPLDLEFEEPETLVITKLR